MELASRKFEAAAWSGIGLVQAVFYLFFQAGLMAEFNIDAETLFSFIYAVRETYADQPFHNWPHAVNVLQFVQNAIVAGRLENVLSRVDILSLYIAALCRTQGTRSIWAIRPTPRTPCSGARRVRRFPSTVRWRLIY
jgi:hypothetical protein